MTAKTKNALSLVLRIGVSAALLVFVFSKIDLKQTVEVLKSASLGYLFIAALTFIAIVAILLYRWIIFIRALDLSATTKNITLHHFYGQFGNLFLPTAIGGDILKAVGLCKSSTQKPRVVASILLDRLSGFASLAIVAIVAFIFGHKYVDDNTLVIPIILMGVGSVSVGAVLLNEKVYSFGCKIFNKLPKFKKSLMTMHYDIALLKESHKTNEAVKAVLVSCVSQVMFAFTYYFTAKALHQDIAVIYFLIFVPLICLFAAVPSIGGLGAREVGAAYLFAKIGVDSGIAVSMALISFLFMVMVGVVGGVLYVYTVSSRRVQHYSSDAGVEPAEA